MIKKLILSIFLIFLLTSSVYADNIRFAQITDAQISYETEYSTRVLKSAIADINKQEGISFVVFTGDNISSANEDSLAKFIKCAKQLKVPYYIALGDHDVYKANGLSKTRYFDILHEHVLTHPQRGANYKFEKQGFVFLIVDGAKEVIPSSAGYYREDTLTWLDKELTKNRKKNVVIFQHFPIDTPNSIETKVKSIKTYKVDDYKTVLSKHHNVLAVISGHYHFDIENMSDGVYHITTSSILTLPQAYRIVDIVTTKEFSPIIYSRMKEFEVSD